MEVFYNIARGSLGVAVLIGICYLLSNNRKAINWRLVIVGLSLQLVFALGVLKVGFINKIFQWVSDRFVGLINLSHQGTDFLFGNLAKADQTWGYVFAIQVLPNIIFFAALSSILYYLGVLQKIAYGFAWVLSKTMKLSGAESMSTAANIFLGQTEAPLMVKPYIPAMSRSEILCIMVGGMANTAGSVLAAYVGFLGGTDPASRSFFALHMLSQSIMSAPAAIVAAKILFPQTEHIETNLNVSKEVVGDNFLDAVSNGTTEGLKLAVNVGAMLVVFTALMAVLNHLFFMIGDATYLNGIIHSWSGGRYDGLTLQSILGAVFAPLAWVMGVPSQDMYAIGQLLGEKTIINEFVAYISLGKMQESHQILSQKSTIIATYALCGFANFASIGIQIGGISSIAPSQRKNLTELGIKALIGGSIACFLTAAIAGMLL